MCALFKIKDPQSLLKAAAESSVTDGCAADDLSRCLDVRVLYRTSVSLVPVWSSAIKAVITVTAHTEEKHTGTRVRMYS